MKKIFSIISAFALCASFAVTSVNAELSYDADLDVVTMPTMEELKARTPEITLSAVKAAEKADIQAAGIPAKQAANYINAEWDSYIVTATVTNVGNLAASYTDTNYGTMAGVVNPGTVLSFTNSEKIKKYGVGTTPYKDASQVGVDGTLNFTFGSATNTGYSYPTFDGDFNGSGLTDPTIEIKFVICIPAGDSLDLVVEDASFYYIWKNGDAIDKHIVKPKVATLTLGEAAPPAPSTPDAVKFYAVLPACEKAEASAVARFQFDDTGDGVADKGYDYNLGSLTWDTDVTVGVQVEDIDDGVTLALTNVLWK